MNKKVGILTFQDSSNFGSALQTYALWKKVKNLGYEPEIIDYICEKIQKNELPEKIKWQNLKSVKKNIITALFSKYYFIKHDNIYAFLKENAKITNKKYYYNNIKETNKKYNQFLVGSDIVWSPALTDDYTYFLNFVSEDKKKISFASSVGNELTLEEKKKIKPLINRFQNVAVRELQSKDWIEELYHKDVHVVCDPTMLLKKEEWEKFAEERIIPEKYVLVYFNSKNNKCLNDAINYAKKHHLKVYYINYGIKKTKFKTIRPKTISEFLNLMLYAEHIFTASYHGLLFSLYFNKPVLFYNRAHKSRMISLSKILEIEDKNGDEIDINTYNVNKNFAKVNKNIEKFRQKSTNILKEMLSKEN